MVAEWREVLLEELASDEPNALATGPFGSAISSKHFTNHGVPVIRGSNLSANISERLNDRDIVFLSCEKAKEFKRSIAKRGDLVFTCWGTINQVGFIDSRSRFDEYIVSNKQMKLTVNRGKVDPLFLYYLFSGPDKQAEILDNGIGSSVPGFNLGQLRKHSIHLPSLAEQRQIIETLGALDDKIALLRETNATLEAIAQALFKSWFVDFDPVRAKAEGHDPEGMPPEVADLFPSEFEDSELGAIPKGWRAQRLDQACEINPTRRLGKGAESSYLEMSAVPTQGHRPETPALRSFSSGTKFTNGDSLLARITPCLENGKSAFVDFLLEGEVGWGSTEFIVLRPRNPLPDYWGYLLCRHEPFRQFAIQAMVGTSGRQRVEVSRLAQFPVAIPTTRITAAFGDLVGSLRVKIASNDDEMKTLAGLRDTLLPRLISGKLRVGEPQMEVR
jgi:type I restriction enzyme S subunit